MNPSTSQVTVLLCVAVACFAGIARAQSDAGVESRTTQRRYGGENANSNTIDKGNSGQVMALAQNLLEKADWNSIYVKMFKMFLNFFMDMVMDRMFGSTLSDRQDPPMKGFLPFPMLRNRLAAGQLFKRREESAEPSPIFINKRSPFYPTAAASLLKQQSDN